MENNLVTLKQLQKSSMRASEALQALNAKVDKLASSAIETEVTGSTNFFKLYGIDPDAGSVTLVPGQPWVGDNITVSEDDTLDDVVALIDAGKENGISDVYFDSDGFLHVVDKDFGSVLFDSLPLASDDSVTYIPDLSRLSGIPQPMSKYPNDVNSVLHGNTVSRESAYMDFGTMRNLIDFTTVTSEIYTGEENFVKLYGIDLTKVSKIYVEARGQRFGTSVINTNETVLDFIRRIDSGASLNFSKVNGRYYEIAGEYAYVARIYTDAALTHELYPSYERVYPSLSVATNEAVNELLDEVFGSAS